ncbi:MAG: SDR family oxidoreductase [Betaproteobacteria bacterium]|jgi:3-hydroxybutyrate dehydrogenase|nr:SDR family oxidoreductase [Betaproteobacteria bacterium]
MSSRLDNQVALITGASRGIGRAIAQAYLKEGARVALVATDAAKLQALQQSWGSPADRVMTLGVDVRDRQACVQAVERVQAQWGGIDILVNNAGVYRAKSFLDYTDQDFQDLLDVNLFGVLHFMQACLPGMQARRRGSIVNIASTAGKWGSRNQSAYNTSKHAVVGLTRCVALEASAHQVRVNAICPGFVQTDMVETLKREASRSGGISADAFQASMLARVPLGRIVEPEEVAEMAVYLGSQESRSITGQSMMIDGGMVML